MNAQAVRRKFSLPPILSSQRNGMTIYGVPRPELPLISIHLILPFGAEADPPGKAGLADLTAEMLTLGTRHRTAAQIAAEVDSLGATLSARAGWHATSLHVQGLKEDLDRLLGMLREIVSEPSFSEEEFAQLRQRRVAMLVQQKDESSIVVRERFEQILFRETPYDHPIYGALHSLPRLSRDEAQEFYTQRFLPQGSFWVFVGDLDPDECFHRVEALFPRATDGTIPSPPFHPRIISGIKTVLVDRPDLTQSQICLGHLGIPPVHPDVFAFEVMNYILGGGGFSSRLMRRIRVERGYTYGVRSSLDLRKNLGSFSIATFTPTETTSRCVQEIFSVVKSFLAEGANPEERSEAIHFLTGSYPLKFETLSQVAQRIIQTEVLGLGIEYLEEYPGKISAVEQEEMIRCAQKNVHPDDVVLAVVGRAEAFRRDFERWGPVEVWNEPAGSEP